MDKQDIRTQYGTEIYESRCGVANTALEMAIAGGGTLAGMAIAGAPLAMFIGAVGIAAIAYRTEIDERVEDFEQGDSAKVKAAAKTLMTPRMRNRFVREMQQASLPSANQCEPVRTNDASRVTPRPEPVRTNSEPTIKQPRTNEQNTPHRPLSPAPDPSSTVGDIHPSHDPSFDVGIMPEPGQLRGVGDHDLDLVDEVDPLVAKYGATLAAASDMHSPHSKPRHLAFLAVTQCGKTTTITALSHALRDRYPRMKFLAMDGKNSTWPNFYEEVVFPGFGDKFKAEDIFRIVKRAYDELGRRVEHELKGDKMPHRILLVLDEWNKTRDHLKLKVGQDRLALLDDMVSAIIFQGLEFGIHLCMVLQEPNCDKIGISDAGRINIHFFALGRSGDRTMIDALLENGMILKSRRRCSQLVTDFETIWNDPDRHPMAPVIVDSRAYTAEALPDFSGLAQSEPTSVQETSPPTPPTGDNIPEEVIRAAFDRGISQRKAHKELGIAWGNSETSKRVRSLFQQWAAENKPNLAPTTQYPTIALF